MTHFIANKALGVILGDGVSTFPSPISGDADIASIALPVNGTFDTVATFDININGNRMLYVTSHVVDLGTVTGNLSIRIEFLDPAWNVWVPSRGFDGANHEFRETDTTVAARTWQIPMVVDQSNTVTSNEEHRHYMKARVRFSTSAAGAADGDTQIKVAWYSDGGAATVPDQ